MAANIVADIVILLSQDAPRFLEKDSVYLVSGIIDTREQDVLDAIGDTFKVLERREEKGWVAMALKMNKPTIAHPNKIYVNLKRRETYETV